MKKYMLSFTIIFACLGISCDQEIPLRNRIIFEDSIQAVTDSLVNMDRLLHKLPENERINYFTDDDGNLFINNEKLGSLKGAINNTRIRNDEVFRNFTDHEVDNFFTLMAYLFRNHIEGAVLESSVEKFVYGYRQTAENRFDDLREILITNSPLDTQTADFKKTYKVLDTEGPLILVAPVGARIR